MKKITLIILGSLLINAQVLAEIPPTTALLPEVQEILTIPVIDESTMEQNAYVHLLAIDAPEGSDYIKIAKNVILLNNFFLKMAVAQQNDLFIKSPVTPKDYFNKEQMLDIDYLFPCANLKNQHCVTDILNNKKQLEQLITDHEVLLGRYKKLIKLPNYNAYYLTKELPIAPLQFTIYLSRLRLAQAVLAIDNGNVKEGLEIIQQEIDFGKRVLLGDGNIYLIDVMIITRQLLIAYHVIEGLVDHPQLTAYLNDPLLQNLLKPLSADEQDAYFTVFLNERRFTILNIFLSNTQSLINEANYYHPALVLQANTAGYPLNIDKNATMNEMYFAFLPYIHKGLFVLPDASIRYIEDKEQYKTHFVFFPYIAKGSFATPDASTRYLEDKEQQPCKKLPNIAMLYNEYGESNLLGGILLIESDNLNYYLHSFYDLSSYLLLANTKLQIKQAGITKDQVASFLADKVRNPYSKEPLIWNAQQQTLSSNWLANKDKDTEGAQATVTINFSK